MACIGFSYSTEDCTANGSLVTLLKVGGVFAILVIPPVFTTCCIELIVRGGGIYNSLEDYAPKSVIVIFIVAFSSIAVSALVSIVIYIWLGIINFFYMSGVSANNRLIPSMYC